MTPIYYNFTGMRKNSAHVLEVILTERPHSKDQLRQRSHHKSMTAKFVE